MERDRSKCPQDRRIEHLRWLPRNDLFFLLVHLLNRKHLVGLAPSQKDTPEPLRKRIADWTFARCTDVQNDPDNNLDLWPREHEKSEIITYGKTIQDVLIDSNETIGIFSHTRPMAKQFLRQIKVEFETNVELQKLFPDILWENPKQESPKWSEDDGIVLKRKSNARNRPSKHGVDRRTADLEAIYQTGVRRRERAQGIHARHDRQIHVGTSELFCADGIRPAMIRYVGTFRRSTTHHTR